MENKVLMRIRKFTVECAEYHIDESQLSKDLQTVTLNPKISARVKRINSDIAEVRVFCELRQEGLPFIVNATICGTFELKDWEANAIGKTMMTQNTLSILYPYVRTTITQLTAMSPFAQCVLPVMNIEWAINNGKIEIEIE